MNNAITNITMQNIEIAVMLDNPAAIAKHTAMTRNKIESKLRFIVVSIKSKLQDIELLVYIQIFLVLN